MGEGRGEGIIFMQPVIQSIWALLQDHIFPVSSQPEGMYPFFNPYQDCLAELDLFQAQHLRRENLYKYLDHFKMTPTVLILGEAPGWRGCRFSGVPFTSEAQLTSGELPFTGKRTSLLRAMGEMACDADSRAPASVEGYREASASIFWRTLAAYSQQFLVWNVFPFHPHQPGKLRSNRKPGVKETDLTLPYLLLLVEKLKPARILAVGKFAQDTLNRMAVPYQAIRHPSHGGARLFMTQVMEIFEESSSRGL